MSAELAIGYARARIATREGSRSFYVASFALPRQRMNAAFALYAFLRALDDAVDDQAATAERLDSIALLIDEKISAPAAGFDPATIAALRDSMERFAVPREPLHEMIEGMRMDVEGARYRTFAELDRYCYLVAGTVGLMMAPILGADRRGRAAAIALGKAMQLTNILRDVAEDLARGRCYLPSEELAAYGLHASQLSQLRISDPRWQAFMRAQIQRARALYAEAMLGIPFIRTVFGRVCVRIMGAIYSDILRAIEAHDYDVFTARVFVSPWRKAWLVLRSAW